MSRFGTNKDLRSELSNHVNTVGIYSSVQSVTMYEEKKTWF